MKNKDFEKLSNAIVGQMVSALGQMYQLPADISDRDASKLNGIEFQKVLQQNQAIQDIKQDKCLSYLNEEIVKLKVENEKLSTKLHKYDRRTDKAMEVAKKSFDRVKDMEKKLGRLEKELEKTLKRLHRQERITSFLECFFNDQVQLSSPKKVLGRLKKQNDEYYSLPLKHSRYKVIDALPAGEDRYE